MSEPSFIPKRDPASIYGPMEAGQKRFKPAYLPTDESQPWTEAQTPTPIQGKDQLETFTEDDVKTAQALPPILKPKNPYAPNTLSHTQWEEQYARNRDWQPVSAIPHTPRPHEQRILAMTIYIRGQECLSLRQEIKFNDLGSPSQLRAIIQTLTELNQRLSAAQKGL